MYAIPIAALLAALILDKQEQPPPPPKNNGFDGSGGHGYGAHGYGAHGYGQTPVSRAELASGQPVYGLSRTEMATPGSWEAAWFGVAYGGNPVVTRIEQINSRVMNLVKQVLGWSAVTKGPKLISINSKRDELIRDGLPAHHPQVAALEKQAETILFDAGMQPGGKIHTTIEQLGQERDRLLRASVGLPA